MEKILSDAKRLVQRLSNHDNVVDVVISETNCLQNRILVMHQYHDEVKKMNDVANHRPRSTLILGSQLENQRIQTLEQENRELSISLAEHQSALELIMDKYRKQVLVMMKSNGTSNNIQTKNENEVEMHEKIAEMANVMRQAALIDELVATKEIETLRSLQIENDNLRELLQISGKCFKFSDGEVNGNLSRNTSSGSIFPSNPNCSFDLNLSPNVEVIKNKDSGIYEDDTQLNGGPLKHVNNSPNKLVHNMYDSLESIDTESNSSNEMLRSHLYDEDIDESDGNDMSCFRALISHIEPLPHREKIDAVQEVTSDTNHNKGFNLIKDGTEYSDHIADVKCEDQTEISDTESGVSDIHDFDKSNIIRKSTPEFFESNENNISNETSFSSRKQNKYVSLNVNQTMQLKRNQDNPLAYLFNHSSDNVEKISGKSHENAEILHNTSEDACDSDADSELTFTGDDDIDDALAGFDSLLDELDLNEDDKHEELD